ncbi:adenylate kinase [Legionella shakespearei]|nr:adenylate kinase [Legionella shakespearei]
MPCSATVGDTSKSAIHIMLIGAPGAGKGTQAERLTQKYHIPQISTGDLLRAELAKGSPLGLSAKKTMEAGGLLSDDLIFALVRERLNQPDCAHGFILDGFPRTLAQAKMLQEAHIAIDHIIDLNIDDQEIIKRMSGRRIHPASGRVYHIVYNPPKVAGKDDLTGQPLVQRKDDEEQTVKKRLAIYHQQTEPLISYYKNESARNPGSAPQLHTISGTGNADEVFKKIVSALDTVTPS